eukprot:jgi/Picsp_1/5587/NSC_02946-R1_protein
MLSSLEQWLTQTIALCVIALGLFRAGSRLDVGWGRGICAILIILVNTIMPLWYNADDVLIKTIAIFQFTWLCNFKVLGWAIGRGPLMLPLTAVQFVCVCLLPITPNTASSSIASSSTKQQRGSSGMMMSEKKSNARQNEQGDTLSKSFLDFCQKCLLLFLTVSALLRRELPGLVAEMCYCLALYAFLAVIMQIFSVLLQGFCGLAVAPHYDQPYLSTSFTDFWSRRWNLNTGYTLRFLIYDPISQGSIISTIRIDEKKKKNSINSQYSTSSKSRRAVALCASFFVSGLMHEMFIGYLRYRFSGYWLTFFAVQGPCIVLEWYLKRLTAPYKLPRTISIPLTLSLLFTLAHYLFFPDIFRMGIPQEITRNVADAYAAILPASVLGWSGVLQ